MNQIGYDALANIMEGLCRPFRVRVEQVLVGGLGGSVNAPDRRREVLDHTAKDPAEASANLNINANPILLYKMSNLLKFYNATILSSLGDISTHCTFLETLEELSALCRKMFLNSLSFFASKMLDKVEIPGPDLSPTEATFQTLQLLRDILSTQAPSKVAHNKNRGSLDSEELEAIVKALSDPLLQMCAMSASQLPPADMAAYRQFTKCDKYNLIHALAY